jgi:type I restriction enzyme R subunit
MPAHAYTEDQLIEQPAIGLFAELGWQTVTACHRVAKISASENQVCLTRAAFTFVAARPRATPLKLRPPEEPK